jgi:hypothetical protein
MVIEQSIENSKRSIEDTIRQIASETFEENRIGKVTEVYPRSLREERFTHECDVLLLSEDREIKNVQVSKTAMDTVSVPRKDDICMVSYEGLRNSTPYISTFYNISRPIDEDRPDDIALLKRYEALPALYGDYRNRKWSEAEFTITRDVQPSEDKDRTDRERWVDDDRQIKLGKRVNVFQGDSGTKYANFDMGARFDLGKKKINIGDFKPADNEQDFNDIEFGITLDIDGDEINILDNEEKANITIKKNSNDEKVVEIMNDEGSPSMGIRLNMDTGEFKIGDGSEYGIESDGNGNFDWYFQSLDMHDDGSKLQW